MVRSPPRGASPKYPWYVTLSSRKWSSDTTILPMPTFLCPLLIISVLDRNFWKFFKSKDLCLPSFFELFPKLLSKVINFSKIAMKKQVKMLNIPLGARVPPNSSLNRILYRPTFARLFGLKISEFRFFFQLKVLKTFWSHWRRKFKLQYVYSIIWIWSSLENDVLKLIYKAYLCQKLKIIWQFGSTYIFL